MEGLTTYYSGQILLRAGFYTPVEYLKNISRSISSLENRPGNKVQSAAMSSFDTWIKFYRRNENSYNTEISYYTKGSLLGMLLDLEIINSTNGKKSYDDVLRLLYNKYYKKLKRGFTDSEYKAAVEKIAGKNLDNFFSSYVDGTKEINYNKYFGYAGLQLIDEGKSSKKKDLGLQTRSKNNNLFVTRVVAGTPAYDNGLNVNDEIIAVNNYRVDKKLLDKFVDETPAGSTLNFLVSRDGKLLDLKVKLINNPIKKFVINKIEKPTDKQIMVYNKWLRIK